MNEPITLDIIIMSLALGCSFASLYFANDVWDCKEYCNSLDSNEILRRSTIARKCKLAYIGLFGWAIPALIFWVIYFLM